MKKNLYISVIIALILSVLPIMTFAANDYTGGYLDGIIAPLNFAGNTIASMYPTNRQYMTDNNDTTYATMIYNQGVKYLLDGVAIDSVVLVAKGSIDNNIRIAFHDAQNKVIDSVDIPITTAKNEHSVTGLGVNNVYGVLVFAPKSATNTIYEFNVYGYPKPPQVSQVVATPLSDTQIRLNWTNPNDIDHVAIYNNDTFIANTTSNTYTLTNLDENMLYKVTLYTSKNGILSSPFNVWAMTLEKDRQAPQEITNLKSTVTNDSIKFTWDNPPDIDFHEVRIFRDGRQIGVAVTPANYFMDFGLEEHTTYTFVFRSVDLEGNASAGISVAETTAGKPRGLTMLTGDAWENEIKLQWSKNSEANKYYIYQDGIKIAETANTTEIIGGLNNGQSYRYAVIPVNEWGQGQQSNEIQLTPIIIPIPEAPTNVRYTATNTTITLTWQPSEYATEYRIYQIKQSETSFFEKILFDRAYAAEEEYIGSTSGTTYTITNLEAGEERTFLVSAANQKGESAKTTVAAKTSAEITWGLTVLELLQAVFQFIMVFANFIILGAIIIFAPRVVRFFKQIAAKNGVKF